MTRRVLPVLTGVVAAVAVLAGVFAAVATSVSHTGSRATEFPRLTTYQARFACPRSYDISHPGQPWVPTVPTTRHPEVSLVPRATPSAALVCAYVGGDEGFVRGPRHALTGARHVTLGLDAVPTSLGTQPAELSNSYLSCTGPGRPIDGDQYLVVLRYRSRISWVSAPGDPCAPSGNGAFTSQANVAAYAAYAYRTGRWVGDPPALVTVDEPLGRPVRPGPCEGTGRLGQQRHLVPGVPETASVCTPAGTRVRTLDDARTRRLTAVLDSLPTQTSRSLPVGSSHPSFDVVFHYADGPSLTLLVAPKQTPPADNLALQAVSLYHEVLQLLR